MNTKRTIRTSKYSMCKPTKKKALNLVKDIIRDIENNCYLIAYDKSELLNKMLKRHQNKEFKF